MKKWERLVRLTVAEAGAKVIDREKSGGHARLVVLLPDGAEHRLVVSSSPTAPEHALRAIRRDVTQLVLTHPAPKGTP